MGPWYPPVINYSCVGPGLVPPEPVGGRVSQQESIAQNRKIYSKGSALTQIRLSPTWLCCAGARVTCRRRPAVIDEQTLVHDLHAPGFLSSLVLCLSASICFRAPVWISLFTSHDGQRTRRTLAIDRPALIFGQICRVLRLSRRGRGTLPRLAARRRARPRRTRRR